MTFTPDETRALLGACGVAVSHLQGARPSRETLDALQHDNLYTFVSVCKKLKQAATELENGMARPHSDKVFLHVGLTPQAHKLLIDHVTSIGGGKIVQGSIGEYLSHVIVSHFKKTEEESNG